MIGGDNNLPNSAKLDLAIGQDCDSLRWNRLVNHLRRAEELVGHYRQQNDLLYLKLKLLVQDKASSRGDGMAMLLKVVTPIENINRDQPNIEEGSTSSLSTAISVKEQKKENLQVDKEENTGVEEMEGMGEEEDCHSSRVMELSNALVNLRAGFHKRESQLEGQVTSYKSALQALYKSHESLRSRFRSLCESLADQIGVVEIHHQQREELTGLVELQEKLLFQVETCAPTNQMVDHGVKKSLVSNEVQTESSQPDTAQLHARSHEQARTSASTNHLTIMKPPSAVQDVEAYHLAISPITTSSTPVTEDKREDNHSLIGIDGNHAFDLHSRQPVHHSNLSTKVLSQQGHSVLPPILLPQREQSGSSLNAELGAGNGFPQMLGYYERSISALSYSSSERSTPLFAEMGTLKSPGKSPVKSPAKRVTLQLHAACQTDEDKVLVSIASNEIEDTARLPAAAVNVVREDPAQPVIHAATSRESEMKAWLEKGDEILTDGMTEVQLELGRVLYELNQSSEHGNWQVAVGQRDDNELVATRKQQREWEEEKRSLLLELYNIKTKLSGHDPSSPRLSLYWNEDEKGNSNVQYASTFNNFSSKGPQSITLLKYTQQDQLIENLDPTQTSSLDMVISIEKDSSSIPSGLPSSLTSVLRESNAVPSTTERPELPNHSYLNTSSPEQKPTDAIYDDSGLATTNSFSLDACMSRVDASDSDDQFTSYADRNISTELLLARADSNHRQISLYHNNQPLDRPDRKWRHRYSNERKQIRGKSKHSPNQVNRLPYNDQDEGEDTESFEEEDFELLRIQWENQQLTKRQDELLAENRKLSNELELYKTKIFTIVQRDGSGMNGLPDISISYDTSSELQFLSHSVDQSQTLYIINQLVRSNNDLVLRIDHNEAERLKQRETIEDKDKMLHYLKEEAEKKELDLTRMRQLLDQASQTITQTDQDYQILQRQVEVLSKKMQTLNYENQRLSSSNGSNHYAMVLAPNHPHIPHQSVPNNLYLQSHVHSLQSYPIPATPLPTQPHGSNQYSYPTKPVYPNASMTREPPLRSSSPSLSTQALSSSHYSYPTKPVYPQASMGSTREPLRPTSPSLSIYSNPSTPGAAAAYLLPSSALPRSFFDPQVFPETRRDLAGGSRSRSSLQTPVTSRPVTPQRNSSSFSYGRYGYT